jgi:hypothetical protein
MSAAVTPSLRLEFDKTTIHETVSRMGEYRQEVQKSSVVLSASVLRGLFFYLLFSSSSLCSALTIGNIQNIGKFVKSLFSHCRFVSGQLIAIIH